MKLNTGCNLREALACATQLGLEVEYVNRTGEVRISSPAAAACGSAPSGRTRPGH